MAWTPSIISNIVEGTTKATKAFFENLREGVEESVKGPSLPAFNGATDGAAINAALEAMGPGVLILPRGAAGIDQTIKLGPSQGVWGEGTGTILKANAGLNKNVIENKTANSCGLLVGNLVVDGNWKIGAENNTSGKGIVWVANGNTLSTKEAANGITVWNVWIRNCAGDGYESENTTNGIVNILENVQSYWNKGNGLTIESSDGKYTNCYAEKNGAIGIQCGVNGALSEFTNCSGSDSGQVSATKGSGYGWKLLSGGITLASCAAQHNAVDGYYVTSSAADSAFSACLAEGNGWINQSYEAGGWWLDSARGATFAGCVSKEPLSKASAEAVKAGETGFQAYGVKITGTSSGVTGTVRCWGNTAESNGAWKGAVLNTSSGAENLLTSGTGNNHPGGLGASIADRFIAQGDCLVLEGNSEKMVLVRIPVAPGSTITAVNVMNSNSQEGTGLTHSWGGLYSTEWKKLAVSADNTGATWGKRVTRTFTLTTPYSVPLGVNAVYACICVTGTKMPKLLGYGITKEVATEQGVTELTNLEPFVCTYGNATKPTPAEAPAEASHAAQTGKVPYVWLT